jgi:hypothetical protein
MKLKREGDKMSSQLVCDRCGKNNGDQKAVMNNGPISLLIENYLGEEYIVNLQVTIKNKNDLDIIENAQNAAIIKNPKDLKRLEELMASKPKVKNPRPHICVSCIRELAHLVMKDGTIDPKNNITDEEELHFMHMPADKLSQLNKENPFMAFSNLDGNIDSLGPLNPEDEELVQTITDILMDKFFSKGGPRLDKFDRFDSFEDVDDYEFGEDDEDEEI